MCVILYNPEGRVHCQPHLIGLEIASRGANSDKGIWRAQRDTATLTTVALLSIRNHLFQIRRFRKFKIQIGIRSNNNCLFSKFWHKVPIFDLVVHFLKKFITYITIFEIVTISGLIRIRIQIHLVGTLFATMWTSEPRINARIKSPHVVYF